jgi:hypothetical protein
MGGVATIGFASTIQPDATVLVNNVGTLTGNITTVQNPSGTPSDGQMLKMRFTQDGSGGRTVTFNGTQYSFGTDVTQAKINSYSGPNTRFTVALEWVGTVAGTTVNKWEIVAVRGGFS